MSKTHIYFMPGLAAGPEIFENLELDKTRYELHFLKWLVPESLEEPIQDYALRMTHNIKYKNIVLVGVSFGGILVQEISKHIKVQKLFLISSVKSHLEFPKSFKLASISKMYKLFPIKLVSNFEDYTKLILGESLKKRAKLYKKYLSERNETYLKWSIQNVLHWQQTEPLDNTVHIHGTKDHVFPIKNISNCIEIENGTHVMIITKAKKISKIIHESLSNLNNEQN